jgi:hypothetical protein
MKAEINKGHRAKILYDSIFPFLTTELLSLVNANHGLIRCSLSKKLKDISSIKSIFQYV